MGVGADSGTMMRARRLSTKAAALAEAAELGGAAGDAEGGHKGKEGWDDGKADPEIAESRHDALSLLEASMDRKRKGKCFVTPRPPLIATRHATDQMRSRRSIWHCPGGTTCTQGAWSNT